VSRAPIQIAAHALAATLVVAGCSVTVQPIRPRPSASSAPPERPTARGEVSAQTVAPLDLDKPVPTCTDAAPPPSTEPSNASFVIQNGHEQNILHIAVSDDGRTLASGANDGTVRLWDTQTGLLLRKVGAKGVQVTYMALSGDGKTLAYYAPERTVDSQTVRVIDLDAGAAPKIVSQYIGPIDLTADGKHLAVALPSLTIFDTKTGKKEHEIELGVKSPSRTAVAYDEADRRVAVAAHDEVLIVDVAAEKVTARVPLTLGAGVNAPRSVALLGDTTFVAMADGTISVHPLAAGKSPHTLAGKFGSMAVTNDRLWVTDLTTQKLTAFAAPDWKEVKINEAPRGELTAASRDGSTIVLAKSDLAQGSWLDVRDAQTVRAMRRIEGRSTGINALAVHPGGAALATGGANNGELSRWDITSGELEPPLTDEEKDTGRLQSLSFNGSGEMLASTTGAYEVRVRDAKSGRTLRRWPLKSGFFTKLVAFLPGTDELLTVRTRTDYESPKSKSLPPVGKTPALPQPPIERYQFAVERWNLGGPPLPFPKYPLGEIARPPGKLVGKEGDFDVTSAALSPDGSKLALVGTRGVVVMNVATGAIAWSKELPRVKAELKHADGEIHAGDRYIGFSPDGKTVLLSVLRLKTEAKIQWLKSVLMSFDAATGKEGASIMPGTTGPIASRAGLLALGGIQPLLLDASSLAVRARVTIPDNQVTAIALHPTRDLFLFSGDAGATSFVKTNGTVTATLLATPNGEYVAATPSGAYRSSLDGARSIAWSFSDPLEGFSFEQFSARFQKPAVLGRALRGEVEATSEQLARPPRLRIEGAATRRILETSARTIPLEAFATSSSRVDRVRVFVDGRPAADQLVCAKEGRVNLDVPLHAGRNRVSVVAYDAAGYASNAQQLDVMSTSPLAEKPDLHVVAIGVSSYPNMTPEQQLEYADDDARSVTESLGRFAGAGKPFGKLVATTLLDGQVTVESVERALEGLSRMRPDDLAIVFLAGHGARLGEGKMVFMTSRAAFTRDSAQAHGIGWDRIEGALRRARGRVLMMLDACHSGHLSTEVVAPNAELARQLAASDRSGIFVFSAARGSQYSYEVPPDEGAGASRGKKTVSSRGLELVWGGSMPPITKELPGGHGLFTSALLQAFEGQAPDRDRSGAIEVSELVDYVTERVRGASNGKQTPWVARREMFGEFMIAPAAR
jgi:WD40 repeat protein